MSVLVFVRDGRTLPYVPVTVAALDAIAVAVEPRRKAYARSLYIAVLELCNESREARVPVSRKQLAERAGISRRLVSELRPDLERAGVVEVYEREFNGLHLENEWVVIEPAPVGTERNEGSARSVPHTRARPSPPSEARDDEGKKNSEEAREIFAEWVKATERDPARTQLTPDRRRVIAAALKSHGRDDCLAAIRNIGASQEARNGYGRGTRFDDVKHALHGAERIEKWRDWQAPANVTPIRKGASKITSGGNLDRFNESNW